MVARAPMGRAPRAAPAIGNGAMMGLYGYQADAWFDDVRVRRVMDPEPTVTLAPVENTCP
jgi:hypothetical protein